MPQKKATKKTTIPWDKLPSGYAKWSHERLERETLITVKGWLVERAKDVGRKGYISAYDLSTYRKILKNYPEVFKVLRTDSQVKTILPLINGQLRKKKQKKIRKKQNEIRKIKMKK